MLQQGQVQNPVLQGSVQLYAPCSSHFSWSCPTLLTAWRLLQRGGGILQIRAYHSAQPCSAHCTLSSLCTESCKSCIKKKKKQSPTCYYFLPSCFSFTSHSSPWEAGLDGNLPSLILPWLPLSSEDTGESLLDLSHIKCYWQIAWWIQLSKFSVATMPMLMDFTPEVHHLALFSHLFLTEQQYGFLAAGLLSVNFKYLCWSEMLHQADCWFVVFFN